MAIEFSIERRADLCAQMFVTIYSQVIAKLASEFEVRDSDRERALSDARECSRAVFDDDLVDEVLLAIAQPV